MYDYKVIVAKTLTELEVKVNKFLDSAEGGVMVGGVGAFGVYTLFLIYTIIFA